MPAHLPVRTAIAAALITSAVFGCQRESTTASAGAFRNEPFFIRGSITQTDAAWGNLVAGEPGTSYRVDKAYFTVSTETEIRHADGSAASAADLRVGRRITLWITGVIMESYPVQVRAKRIVID